MFHLTAANSLEYHSTTIATSLHYPEAGQLLLATYKILNEFVMINFVESLSSVAA